MPTAAKATGMYINSSLAKVEAVRAGYDEAVMLTTEGYVSEGTGENLFLVRDGVIIATPNSAVGALEGITASAIRKIAEDLGYTVRAVSYTHLSRSPESRYSDGSGMRPSIGIT